MVSVIGAAERSVRAGRSSVTVTSEDQRSLDVLKEQLRDRHVRSAARRLAMRGGEGKKLKLMINRQAAFVGVLALCASPAESPLGPIYLTVETDGREQLVAWLTDIEA
jgi:predicted RNA binding protein with dsRBD fold (UPF0201 family)